MFGPSKDKIDEVYASLRENFKIEDDGEITKYLEIELERRPYGSTHLGKHDLNQRILNMILGMDKSSAKPTLAVQHPRSKNKGSQARKMTLITDH